MSEVACVWPCCVVEAGVVEAGVGEDGGVPADSGARLHDANAMPKASDIANS
jgi:hypothetical protein